MSTTVRIFSRASEELCLAVRDGKVVLATNNPSDEYQHWIKDDSLLKSSGAFVLVNKATGTAISHAGVGYEQPLLLVAYNREGASAPDRALQWEEADKDAEGFYSLFPAATVHSASSLVMDAYNAGNDPIDGARVQLFYNNRTTNQKWKMVPLQTALPQPGVVHDTMRIFSRASEELSLAVRDGKVVLATNNPRDEHQHWIKDDRLLKSSSEAFVLVNKATGTAISHAGVGHLQPLLLVAYNTEGASTPDRALQWEEADKDADVAGGFYSLRPATVDGASSLVIDAYNADNDPVDGARAQLYNNKRSTNQQWKMVPQTAVPKPGVVHHPMAVVFSEKGGRWLAVDKNSKLVLANPDPFDDSQVWFKRFDLRADKDVYRHPPPYALVNKLTGQAINAHSPDELCVKAFTPNYDEQAFLWVCTDDYNVCSRGFRTVTMLSDTSLGLAARGTPSVVLGAPGPTDRWKILPIDRQELSHNYDVIVRDADPLQDVRGNLHTGIYLRDKSVKYWVDETTGANCFTFFPKSLIIEWMYTPKYWQWTALKDTSDDGVEVINLIQVWRLDIKGAIESSYLTPGVLYEAFFEVMLTNNASGWKPYVGITLSLIDGTVCENYREDFNSKPRNQWLRVKAGEFQVEAGKKGQMFASLAQTDGNYCKTGMTFKGISYLPKKS